MDHIQGSHTGHIIHRPIILSVVIHKFPLSFGLTICYNDPENWFRRCIQTAKIGGKTGGKI
jgi:hypothetical protein